jgi:hypothetical protein
MLCAVYSLRSVTMSLSEVDVASTNRFAGLGGSKGTRDIIPTTIVTTGAYSGPFPLSLSVGSFISTDSEATQTI